MAGASQNLNGSRDITPQGWFVIYGLETAMINFLIKFSHYLHHYEDIKGITKCENGMAWSS